MFSVVFSRTIEKFKKKKVGPGQKSFWSLLNKMQQSETKQASENCYIRNTPVLGQERSLSIPRPRGEVLDLSSSPSLSDLYHKIHTHFQKFTVMTLEMPFSLEF